MKTKNIFLILCMLCIFMTACNDSGKDYKIPEDEKVKNEATEQIADSKVQENSCYLDIETAQKNKKLFIAGNDGTYYVNDGKIYTAYKIVEGYNIVEGYHGLPPIHIAAEPVSDDLAIVDEKGDTYFRKTQVFEGEKITAIYFDNLGSHHSAWLYGITEDGRVLVIDTGDSLKEYVQLEIVNVEDISLYESYLVARKKDGTAEIIYTGHDVDENPWKECDISSWNNLAQVVLGCFKDESDGTKYGYGVVGLKKDGTIVASGYYPKEILEWTDIVLIATDEGGLCLAGLKNNGTIKTAGLWKELIYQTMGSDEVKNIKVIAGNRNEAGLGAIGFDNYVYGMARQMDYVCDLKGEIVENDLIKPE